MIACNKEPISYTFQGKVNELYTSEAISDMIVEAYQLPFENSLATNNFELVASTSSGSSGTYELSFEREKATEFKLKFIKSGFFTEEVILQSSEVSSENPNEVDVTVASKSWIQFDIKNVQPAASTDELKLILYDYREGCEGCATQDYNIFTGAGDTMVTYATNANTYFKFSYISNTGSVNETDSLYLVSFDTVKYNISY